MLKKENKILILLIIFSFLVRIIPAIFLQDKWYDILNMEENGKLVLDGINPYVRTAYNYPPPWMFVSAFFYKISMLSGISFITLIKIPAIIADVLIVVFIFKYFLDKRCGIKTATVGGIAYGLNPIPILISGFHGQFDAIVILFMLMSYIYREKETKSALLMGAAIIFKQWPVLFLPFFVRESKNKFRYLTLNLIPITVSLLPFMIISPLEVIRNVFAYSSAPDYGWASIVRIWFYFHYGYLDIPQVAAQIGKIMVLVGVIVVYLRYKDNLIKQVIVVFLVFYFFSSGVGSQYLGWILPFAILSNSRMIKWYTSVASIALISYYFAMAPQAIGLNWEIYSRFDAAKPYAVMAGFIWVVWGYWLLLFLQKKDISKTNSFYNK